MIELKSVSGSFGAGKVRDVSFRLPNGKTYGVFSSRYADSVTLLTLMSGARTLTGGTVLAGGFDLHREPRQARKEIGFLPAYLLPDEKLTPIEYLMSVADARELPFEKTLRYAHELLELADLSEKKERLIAHLSHGEKRALCLLQLLLCKPEILILISPLEGLIPKDAQKICELIQYFADTYTIFLCTPSSQDLLKLCDEILVLQDGALKTILSADNESLGAEFSVAPAEAFPAPESNVSKSNRTRALLKLLMQKNDSYEVLDSDKKEGDN